MLTSNDRQQQTVTALIQTERTDGEMTEQQTNHIWNFFTLDNDKAKYDFCYVFVWFYMFKRIR